MAVDGSLNFNTKIDTGGFKSGTNKISKEAEKSANDVSKKIQAILDDTERSYKSKAATIAGIYRKQGLSMQEAMKKAWSQIERGSADAVKQTKSGFSAIGSSSKKINVLGKSFASVKDKFSGVFKPFNKSVSTAENSISRLRSSLGGLAKIAATAFAGKQLIDYGKNAVESASDLAEAQNVVDVSFGKSADKMEKFADTCVETYGISKLTAKQTGSTFAAMGSGMGLAEDSATDMAVAMTGLSADMASFYNVEQDVAATALKSVYTGETETLKQFGIVMTEANLEAYALSQGITKSYSAMSQAEKVQLRYNYVMQQTSLAQGDFARTSNGWANQTRMLSEKWKELSTVVGGVLMNVLLPAVKALNGAMTQIINVAQNAADALAKVFGIQTQSSGGAGAVASSTAEVADSSSEAADNYSDMAESAKEAEKANKGSLASFDKLNTLSKSNTEESSSFNLTPASSVSTPAVDTSKIEGSLKNLNLDSITDLVKKFGNKINDLFKNIDWEEIGTNLGNGINKVLKVLNTAFTSIDWKLIGTSFANGVNGLVKAVDWDLLGQTIGNKFNISIKFLDGFISNLDWASIGSSFAVCVSSIFDTVDWQGIVNIVVNGTNGVATAISNFVNNIDWTGLGKGFADKLNQVILGIDWALLGSTFGDSVQGMIDTAYGFVTTYDWGSFASGISTSINNFFSSIDWSKAGATVGKAIKGIFTEIGTFLKEVDWNKIGKDIGKFLSGIDWGGICNELWNVIKAAISGAFGGLTGLITGIITGDDGISPLKTAFLALGTTIGGIKLGSTFVTNINDVCDKLRKFKTAYADGSTTLQKFATNVKSGASHLKNFATNIGSATANIVKNTAAIVKNIAQLALQKAALIAVGIKNFAVNIATATANIAKNTAAIVKNIAQLALQKAALLAQKVATVATTAAQAALNLIMSMNPIALIIIAITALIAIFVLLWNKCDGFREFWINLWDKVKEIASTVWEAIKGFFVSAWNAIKAIWSKAKEFFSGIWNGIKSVFSGVVAWFKNIFTSAWNAIKAVFSGVKTFFTNIWNGIKTVFSSVGIWFKNIFSKAWDGIKTVWNNVKGFFSGIWDGIKGVFSGIGSWFKDKFKKGYDNSKAAWSNAKEGFSAVWSKIKSVFSNVGSWFKNIFSGAWDGIKSIWDKVAGWFKKYVTDPIKNAFNTMWNGIKKIINGMLSGIESFINFFIGGLNFLIKGINKIAIDVPDWVPGIGGKTIGFDIKQIGEVELPRLATGTVVPANYGDFAAILGDNKKEPEVVSPLSTMKQAMLEALKESGMGSNTNIVIEASGNESELIKYLTFKIKREEKRQGGTEGLVMV